MGNPKPGSIRRIEEKMAGLEDDSFRKHVLASAKDFKTSWIELGRALYTVWKDKLYKEWGYSNFQSYTAGEIGIRKQTAMKLVKSYYFLEKEEPQYLAKEYLAQIQTQLVPSHENVDLLRLAKNKKELEEEDYLRVKEDIFQKGKDSRQVKRDLTALIRQREELDPQQAWQKRKTASIKRMLSLLKSLKQDIETSKLLPVSILKDTEGLIKRLEAEIKI